MASEQKVNRREWLKLAGGTGAGLVVGGVAGYLAAPAAAPSTQPTTTVTATTCPPAQAGLSGEIPIGWVFSAGEEVGRDKVAVDLAEEDVNKYCQDLNLPVRFKVLQEMAEESATKAVERADALYAQGVQAITCGWSSHCKAILEVANQRHFLLVSPGSSSPFIATPNDYLLRLSADDSNSAKVYRRACVDLGIKAVMGVYFKEPFAQGLWDSLVPLWKESGIELLEGVPADPEKKEFTGEVAELKKKYDENKSKYKDDEIAIFIMASTDLQVPLLNGIAQYPDLMKLRVFDTDSGNNSGILQYAGEVAAKTRYTAYGASFTSSPKTEAFAARHLAKAGYAPMWTAYNAYDILWIEALCILQSGKYDGPTLLEWFPKVAENYFGVSGWCALNEAGDRKYPAYDLWQVVSEAGTPTWKITGSYDGVMDKITYK